MNKQLKELQGNKIVKKKMKMKELKKKAGGKNRQLKKRETNTNAIYIPQLGKHIY